MSRINLLDPSVWLVIGLVGQGMFTARFLVQWLASERKRETVVPLAFWWLSLAGGLILLSYALYRRDTVFTLGQSTGVFIYVRNLMLASEGRRRSAARAAAAGAEQAPALRGPHLERQTSLTARPATRDRTA
jgi:lipid-A-disaccharide synthase-like uncharacterized protein